MFAVFGVPSRRWAGAGLAVCAAIAAAVVWAADTEPTPDSARSSPRESEFARLEARSFLMPALRPGGDCPLAAAIQVPGVPAEGGLGPGDGSDEGLAALARGPVYAVFPGVPRLLDFAVPNGRRPVRSERERPSADVLWVARPSYDGPVLIRGRQVGGPNRLGFGTAPRPKRQLRLGRDGWVSGGPFRVWGQRADLPRGWRAAVTTTRGHPVRPGEDQTSCYAYQVDGNGFSYQIVFVAVAPIEERTNIARRRH